MIMMSIEIWRKMFLSIYLRYSEDHCHNQLFYVSLNSNIFTVIVESTHSQVKAKGGYFSPSFGPSPTNKTRWKIQLGGQLSVS